MSLFSFLFGESTTTTDDSACREQKQLVVPKNGDAAKRVAEKRLIIPDGVTNSGMNYSGNKLIEELEVPCSVCEIPHEAFKGCSGLKRVVLQNGVRKIGKGAFKNCEKLTYIKIPNSIKSIESEAFSGCSCLSTIEIDDISSWLSVSCPYSIFYETPGHEILVRGRPYTEFSDEAINLVSYPNREAFVKCSSLRSIVFAPTTKGINLSFSSCVNVEKIVLPDERGVLAASDNGLV